MDKEKYKKRIKSHHMGNPMKEYMEGMVSLAKIMEKSCDRNKNSIYIHVPFCRKICTFCNMRRELSDCNPSYARYILNHIDNIRDTEFIRSCPVDAVYFGGGTPTTMAEEDLKRILLSLRENFMLSPDCEITMETTLSEMTPEKLENLMDAGLNRISVGIQTFQDRGRKLLGRRGSGKFAEDRIKSYLNAGLENTNVDLIYNYPGETEDELAGDLEVINSLDIAGFSMYSLIAIKESSLGKSLSLIDETEETLREELVKDRMFFDRIAGEMRKEGFEFLELTKMVRPGRDQYKYIRSRNGGNYTIPLGAGAGGNIKESLIMNPIGVEEYGLLSDNPLKKMVPEIGSGYFSKKNAVSSLQFLKTDIFDYPPDMRERVADYLMMMSSEGYMERKESQFFLTDKGIFFGNNISSDLWEILN